jgi:putative ABC transport system permease protein
MALGAGRRDILRLVLRGGARLICAGVAIGLAGAFVVTRLLSAMLYKVEPYDPITFGCVMVLLCAVAMLASYIPARRATRIDPMVALRYE